MPLAFVHNVAVPRMSCGLAFGLSSTHLQPAEEPRAGVTEEAVSRGKLRWGENGCA